MEIKSSEFFKNIKSLPPVGSEEFKQLIKWEEEKILGGITVNGIHISGWLYWHLNHWWIRIDDQDEFGNDIRIECLPELRDNEWIRAEALEKCRELKQGYIEVGGRQGGKDLLNTSLLYTKDNTIEIGNCEIGQKIYDDSGNLTTITGKYPQGKKPVYKVTLIDGRELFCGLDHNWYVWDRKKSKYIVKTTKELINDYRYTRPSWLEMGKKNPYEFRYYIPTNKVVNYPENKLEIEPYLLGLWLGDGSNYWTKITTKDKEIEDYIRDYAKRNNLKVNYDGNLSYDISSGERGGSQEVKNKRNPFNIYLKKQKLYKNKHIPKEYLYSSEQQRMELLRGLMDSDGSCDKTGTIEYTTTDEQLATDICFLCRSLGIVVKKTRGVGSYKKDGVKIICKPKIRLFLFTDKKIFRLTRKLANLKNKPKYGEKCAITNIEYVFDDLTTCITVDNESHLFLTDDFTVTHNSEMEASYFGMNAIMFQNTQNVIVCGNDNDLSLLKDKVDFGLRKLWKGLAIPRLDKTWKSNQVRLGYKTPDGDDKIWSYIVIRNAKDGHNTEVAAGTTAKSFIMDEVGKYMFSGAFKAAEPAFKGKNGWRAVPILVGTGGAFENGKDAENFFYNPEANNFLPFDQPDGTKTGLFLSGEFRQDCKYKTTLDKYLINVHGKELKDTSELSQLEIFVSDRDKAHALITKERAAAKLNPDSTIYLKQVMYYPLLVEECFLSVSQNIFDIEGAKRQKAKIMTNESRGSYVNLFDDGDGVKHEFSNKLPISNFPLKPHDNKDAPVVIYEFPIENPPFGLYVAGIDPYRQGKAEYSTSLGSVYIYKRMHSINSEKYQDMFVASYCARPDDKRKWEEQARYLIKYYNARALVENDEISFIDYMISVNDQHYLEKQPVWVRELVPNSTVNRDYGIHRSAEKIRDFLHGCLKKYTEEVIHEEKGETEDTTIRTKGMVKILDPLLLEEIAQYNETGNFDRIIAAELAIALAMKMDPIIGAVNGLTDTRIAAIYANKKNSKLFNSSKPLFKQKKKLF